MKQDTLDAALKKLFKNSLGEAAETCSPISSDGSNRKYFRLTGKKHNAVGTFGPDPKENEAFLAFSRHFRRCGMPVPEIYGEDLKQGIYVQEDLGDTTLFKFLSENRNAGGFAKPVIRMYEKAVSLVAEFQITAGKKAPYDFCYPRASFDRQSMMWDMNHFKYYFLQLAQIQFHEQALENDFVRFAGFLLKSPRHFFLYRDFQSRNIMIQNNQPYFIDYQGGRKGALQYDIASLLFDAKADIPFDLREKLLELYIETALPIASMKRQDFLHYYHAFVLIRILQAMGAYGLRGFHERKSHFLQSIPFAIRNLEYLQRKAGFLAKLPELSKAIRRITASSYLRQFAKIHLKLTVRVQSFPYKTGIPLDETGHGGGYVFDCRNLPNPGKHAPYAPFTGKDKPVIRFLEKEPAVREYLGHVFELIDRSIKNYQSRNFTVLTVAFGCTGGQHRSVYCAERLAEHLREKYKVDIELHHLALEKHPALKSPLTLKKMGRG